MYHDMTVVDYYPLAVAVALIVDRLHAAVFKDPFPDIVGDGRYLRGVAALTYNQRACGGSVDTGKIDNGYAAAFLIGDSLYNFC